MLHYAAEKTRSSTGRMQKCSLDKGVREHMPKQHEGLWEAVKQTGASLGEAVTVAMEAVTDYLTPTPFDEVP